MIFAFMDVTDTGEWIGTAIGSSSSADYHDHIGVWFCGRPDYYTDSSNVT